MLYRITNTQYTDINAQLPSRLKFGYYDGVNYILDEHSLQYFDVDLDSILGTLYSQTLQEFLDSLTPIKNYKVYDHISDFDGDKTLLPDKINFNTGLDIKLHKRIEDWRFGDITKIVYYETFVKGGDVGGADLYQNPVVEEILSYTNHPDLTIERTRDIKWYFDDYTLDTDNFKSLPKYYKGAVALNLYRTRRENNVLNVLDDLVHLVMMSDPTNYPTADLVVADGITFFTTHSNDRIRYEKNNDTSLLTSVQNDTSMSWMDNEIQSLDWSSNPLLERIPLVVTENPASAPVITIRDHIIYELSMGETYPT